LARSPVQNMFEPPEKEGVWEEPVAR